MSDPIEDRLRAHAAQARAGEPPAPPFDTALDAAIVPRRARPITWLAIAAAVLLLAGVAAVIVVRPWTGPTQPGASTRIEPITNLGFSGAVLKPGDPRTVYVLVESGSGADECTPMNPQAAATAQTAKSVTITVSGDIRVPASAPRTGYFGFSCSGSGEYVQVPVLLTAPIGHRTVIDAASKKAQPVLDPTTVPTPGSVPDGYSAEPVTWDLDAPQALPSATSITSAGWPGLRRYRHGDDVLDVRVGTAKVLGAPSGTGPRLTVNGQPASIDGHPVYVVQSDNPRCLQWTVSADRSVQVCSQAIPPVDRNSTAINYPSSAPLSSGDLLVVARSLP